MHNEDDTHPKMEQLIPSISMDGREDQDLLNVQTWITNSGVHDWKTDRGSDDSNDSDVNDVND